VPPLSGFPDFLCPLSTVPTVGYVCVPPDSKQHIFNEVVVSDQLTAGMRVLA